MNTLFLDTQANASGGLFLMIAYCAIIFLAFWFVAIRPQKKQQKQHQDLLATLAIGDSILTTSGFYGVVIDVMEEVVIVEFGSNKNCRIPMKKEAIVDIEKTDVKSDK